MKRILSRLLVLIVLLTAHAVCMAQQTTVSHIVDRGETLASIAARYHVTEAQIIELNPQAGQFIYVGMELTIPATATPAVPAQSSNMGFTESSSTQSAQSSSNYWVPTNGYDYGSDNLNFFLAVQGGFGFSTFQWSEGNVNGTMSFSGDISLQLYFEEHTSFIPRNWFSELAIGYDRRGAVDFEMNYVHARIYPLGYRIPVSSINIVFKAGVSLAYPLSELNNYWKSDFQVGVGGGFQIDWKRFSIGCNVEYDFTEVSAACNQTLNNMAVLGTISYKFLQF